MDLRLDYTIKLVSSSYKATKEGVLGKKCTLKLVTFIKEGVELNDDNKYNNSNWNIHTSYTLRFPNCLGDVESRGFQGKNEFPIGTIQSLKLIFKLVSIGPRHGLFISTW